MGKVKEVLFEVEEREPVAFFRLHRQSGYWIQCETPQEGEWYVVTAYAHAYEGANLLGYFQPFEEEGQVIWEELIPEAKDNAYAVALYSFDDIEELGNLKTYEQEDWKDES